MRSIAAAALLSILIAPLGCSSGKSGPAPAGSSAPAIAASSAPAEALPRAFLREGQPLARAVTEPALYLADEDHGVVRRLALPAPDPATAQSTKLPGPPANLVALAGRAIVTVRGVGEGTAIEAPGLLLSLRSDPEKGLVEERRTELPADAWGLAVTPDEALAIVTSAWTHQVSAVELATGKKLWSVDVAREPRGVVVLPDGKTAYVTHLQSASLTRIDDLAGSPKVRRVPFPAAPLRTPAVRAEAATLGIAPVISPEGDRIFLARQALGAVGKRAWNGQPTVDVFLVEGESELAVAPPKNVQMFSKAFQRESFSLTGGVDTTLTGAGPTQAAPPFVGVRAGVYRKATRSILVASEGTDDLVELDALAIDPSQRPLRTYDLGDKPSLDFDSWPFPRMVTHQEHWAARKAGETKCGAPSGVALSADEATAYVFCRTTDGLAVVNLDSLQVDPALGAAATSIVKLGDDPLPAEAALGRRLFYNAADAVLSGGFACNGCHPDGRDDGHVWHEEEQLKAETEVFSDMANLHAFAMNFSFVNDSGKIRQLDVAHGNPRQTPMLAGRVRADGPYGWKARNPNLRHRIVTGFKLHRWGPDAYVSYGPPAIERADAIAAFLRQGLVPPPREKHDLSAEEQRGRAVFNDAAVGCAECHVPSTEYTHRKLAGLGEWRFDRTQFDDEQGGSSFKTPSLFFVGGTPPYFHDGSAPTLEELVEKNGTRMGHTAQLSKDDRAALVAFLRTL